jgi:flavodoxin
LKISSLSTIRARTIPTGSLSSSKIEPVDPYPDSYNAAVEQAKKEIRTGYKPALRPLSLKQDPIDIVFVGTPNWWSTMAPPVSTFLSEHDLSGKTIIPFCTHGGGGLDQIEKDIRKFCPKSTFLESLALSGSRADGARDRVTAWLQKLGIS